MVTKSKKQGGPNRNSQKWTFLKCPKTDFLFPIWDKKV
jgi:hypothetical protein